MLTKFAKIKNDFEIFAKEYFFAQPIKSLYLQKAMEYSFLDGGKRIRAILSLLSGKCFGCSEYNVKHIAFALEAIHAYSLIHDDLPAMDNAGLRRGKLACHIQFNEATAVLAGDALQSLAFQSISQLRGISFLQLQRILNILATHIGCQGMVDGQQLDINSEKRFQDINTIKVINLLKTGKVLTAAIVLPFLASSNHENSFIKECLITFSQYIGLAFQIKDDLLEMTSDTRTLGKDNTRDFKLKKTTYPSVIGIRNTERLLHVLLKKSKRNLYRIKGYNIEPLSQLAEYIVSREN